MRRPRGPVAWRAKERRSSLERRAGEMPPRCVHRIPWPAWAHRPRRPGRCRVRNVAGWGTAMTSATVAQKTVHRSASSSQANCPSRQRYATCRRKPAPRPGSFSEPALFDSIRLGADFLLFATFRRPPPARRPPPTVDGPGSTGFRGALPQPASPSGPENPSRSGACAHAFGSVSRSTDLGSPGVEESTAGRVRRPASRGRAAQTETAARIVQRGGRRLCRGRPWKL